MPAAHSVAVLVGSLRSGSYNRMLALALEALAPDTLQFELVKLGELPLYNEDLESAEPPAAWTQFRAQIQSADAVLCVTPEYNRSIPAVLKNAIDVGSRPYGKSVWSDKPLAIISASPGGIGGFGANQHVRQSFSCLNVALLPGPEMYIGGVDKLFDAAGTLQNDGTRKFLQGFCTKFASWVQQHAQN